MSNNVNNIQDSLYNAMSTVVNTSLQDYKSTQIIIGKIIQLPRDKDTSYLVEYQQSKFSAYPIIDNQSFLINQNVYIIVPDGDMSKEKIILCKTHV